jgi:hypothetical protein
MEFLLISKARTFVQLGEATMISPLIVRYEFYPIARQLTYFNYSARRGSRNGEDVVACVLQLARAGRRTLGYFRASIYSFQKLSHPLQICHLTTLRISHDSVHTTSQPPPS